jgi:hypothetical protein
MFGSLLISSEAARPLLLDVLKREFCAELLGFLLACEEVRDAARSALRCSARVPPVATPAAASTGLVEGSQAHSLGPSRPLPLPQAVPDDHDVMAACPDLPPDSDAIQAWGSFVEGYSRLLVQYVVPGAPNQVNISSGLVRALETAAAGFVRAGTRGLATSASMQGGGAAVAIGSHSGDAASLVEAGLRAMLAAQRDVFRLLIAGPVYRLVRNPSSFGAAVAALSGELQLGRED